MIEWAIAHWEFSISAIGLVVWATRVEGKNNNNEKRITHAEQQLENLESGIAKEMSEVKQSLARIEGYMKAKSEQFNDHQ